MTKSIRRATPADLDAISDLMKDAHNISDSYNALPYNEARTRMVLENFMDKPKVWFYVTDNVDAMLIGEVTSSWLHDGLTAITHVVYAKEGAYGLPLIRGFLRWAKEWKGVRKIQISTSFAGKRGDRANTLLKRLGFTPAGSQFIEVI